MLVVVRIPIGTARLSCRPNAVLNEITKSTDGIKDSWTALDLRKGFYKMSEGRAPGSGTPSDDLQGVDLWTDGRGVDVCWI